MEAARKQRLRRLVLALDGLILLGSMLVAFILHQALRDVILTLKEPPPFRQYVALAYLAVPVWLLILVFRLDRYVERLMTWSEIIIDLINLHVAGLVALAVILMLTQSVINRS